MSRKAIRPVKAQPSAMSKAKVARYKTETSMLKRGQKYRYRQEKRAAKARVPIEKQRIQASVAKHATWAAAASDIFGKGVSAVPKQTQTAATVQQNVDGGLVNTQSGRQDDVDVVDEGGVVF